MNPEDLRLHLLMREWEHNVLLYIDQDKRGFDRIKMFLLIHAGFLVIYSALWKSTEEIATLFAAWVVAGLGICYVIITWLMSNRSHTYVLLRKAQGMLIERKIKALLSSKAPWRTDSGIVTTFTREHIAIRSEEEVEQENRDWHPLKDEITEFGERFARPFTKDWPLSIYHLTWMNFMYLGLGLMWVLLAMGISVKCWGQIIGLINWIVMTSC